METVDDDDHVASATGFVLIASALDVECVVSSDAFIPFNLSS